MAQALSTLTAPPTSPGVDASLTRELAVIRNGMRDGGLTEEVPTITRARLNNRLELLRSSVKQAALTDIEEQIAKLLMGYSSMRGLSKTDAQVMARQYGDALLGLPLWAIADACKDVSRGAVPDLNPDFPPSAPRLRQLADRYVSAVHKEAIEIKSVLSAPSVLPDNPEMAKRVQERVKAGFAELSETLHNNLAPTNPSPATPAWKAPTPEEIRKHYDTHGLAMKPKPVPQTSERGDFE
jgi:hypothetical protein